MTSVARDIFVRRYVVPLLSGDEMKEIKKLLGVIQLFLRRLLQGRGGK